MRYTYTLLPLITSLISYAATTQPDPSQVRQMIGREKVMTFSKDYLIRKGVDEKELASWNNARKKARSFITAHDVPNSVRHFYTLDTANIFVDYAIKKLHENFATHYQEQKGEYIPADMATLTPEQVDLLTTINAEAKKQRTDVLVVSDAAFPRPFVDAQPAPNSWLEAIITDKNNKFKKTEALFPNYKKFFKDYAASNDDYTTFKKTFGAVYGLKTDNKESFTSLLEYIENYLYLLSTKKSLSAAEKEQEALLKKCVLAIRTEFPTIISALDFYKMSRSTSMERTVLSAYAEAMEGVLNQIIRETNTLIDAVKK